MKNLMMSIALLLSVTSQAKVSTSLGYSTLITKTTVINGEDFISFNYCQAGTQCRTLGPKKLYKRRNLEDRRFHERMEIGYSSVADVGVGIVALWASLSAAVAYGASVAFTLPAGASAGIITPVISGSIVDRLNPLEQYRQASTLSDDVLDDQSIVLKSEKDLLNFVKRLELILNK